jgi:hypothetical protein
VFLPVVPASEWMQITAKFKSLLIPSIFICEVYILSEIQIMSMPGFIVLAYM